MAGSQSNDETSLISGNAQVQTGCLVDKDCNDTMKEQATRMVVPRFEPPCDKLKNLCVDRKGKKTLPSLLLKPRQPPRKGQHDDDKNDWRIRCRYLHSLGMDNELVHHDHPKPNSSTHNYLLHSSDHSATASPGDDNSEHRDVDHHSLEAVPVQTVPLKADGGAIDELLSDGLKTPQEVHPVKMQKSNKTASTDEDTCRSSRVSFATAVKVREIPSHKDYSERMRSTMWMLPMEAAESICKNAIEFLAEGCEPERVLDESDFVEREGKLVHPVCLLLEEPENKQMKTVYYGIKPDAKKR
eukprot:CAMPEP_0176019296 /NCGR_PEP_ID=MMETSP0120_2-20121206/9318_1 /TAXON_ID=160619 /ORGANISM="Kryptoperidinium foliaceum, Strain CCMP 1326" /LENGTH=298 /DNA_ID=CAMNT_0017352369 /DNA_START=515 /DNA_END=1407 /DNA_ORIENTATION=+